MLRAEAQREVQLLLARALGWDLARLLAHPETQLDIRGVERYERMLARRCAHEPIAYILGEREFYGLPFEVTPAVLIPRPETELLVDVALARISETVPARVCDLGSGSGCIGVTLAKLRPLASVLATDISAPALAVVARNAARHGVSNLSTAPGSWYQAVGSTRFDMIVSNPPYIAESDPHLRQGDLRFEPRPALVAGRGGLDALQEIVACAPRHLLAGGWLIVEHGHDQAAAVQGLLQAAGLTDLSSHLDLAGIPRVIAGRLP